MSDHDSKALGTRNGDVEAVLIEQEPDATRRSVSRAGSHRDNDHWRFLALKLVDCSNSRIWTKFVLQHPQLHVIWRHDQDIAPADRRHGAGIAQVLEVLKFRHQFVND